MLLELGVHGIGLIVDHDRAAARAAISADRQDHAAPELGVQVFLEEIGWLHDVHVAIDESQAILHSVLLEQLVGISTRETGPLRGNSTREPSCLATSESRPWRETPGSAQLDLRNHST